MASTGEQLGRYHLVRKLAQGGMAEVFLAKVMGPGGFEKSLVIKRILPNLAKDPEFVSMFLQEARLAAQFGHPAVVQIFDFGEVNGSYFLAMEFVDGPNLRSILRAAPEKRISPVVGARVIEEACEGLAYVHEFADASGVPMGLMHCDVSTDNLLIARNGAVKVVDFGVAKGAGQESNAAPGTVKGKIAYMPPEQIIGEADLRADVYALGVILYELASGTRPYESQPDQQLLAAIITTDPVPLLTRRSDIPREYAQIVHKAMAKNLSQRFQNCRELAAALEEFVANSGQRVGTRQLAALAAQFQEAPEGQPSTGTPVLATPTPAARVKQLTPVPTSSPRIELRADPFAAFGAPLPKARPSAPAPAPAPPVSSSPSRAESLFSDLFSDLDTTPPIPPGAPVPPPPAPAAAGDSSEMKITVGTTRAPLSIEAFNAARAAAIAAAGGAPPPEPPSPPPPSAPRPDTGRIAGVFTSPSRVQEPPRPPAVAVAVAKQPTPLPVARLQVLNTPEARAALVMADASNMRLYEPGAPLASLEVLESLRRQFELDDTLNVMVRFPLHAHRLLSAKDAEVLVAERITGAVEGLLLAEAWGALATLLEKLRAASNADGHQRALYELALSTLATGDQARRISQRLREAPPSDMEGLGRLLPFFGAPFARVWLTLFENLDLPASRDAVLPGLAGLAGLNPEPFLEKLAPKRPRRLMELAFCVETGRVPDRQRIIKELLARLDAGRRRDVLTGVARAATEDAFRVITQAITDEPPRASGQEADAAADLQETRVHALHLLGKYFPDRVLPALQPLLTPQRSSESSEPIRRAMWVAAGASTSPAAFDLVVNELNQKPPLLGRVKHDARKVEVLEALSVMKTPQAAELMRRMATDKALSDTVRAAADRHLRAAELIERTTTATVESRRWDRNPPTWKDVLLDLASLAGGSRLVEVDSATFDVAFARMSKCLATLLPAGTQAVVNCTTGLTVNGELVHEGSDPSVDRVVKAFQTRGIGGFTFTRQPARAELEHLVRWLAAGAAAESVETPSITLLSTVPSTPKPPPPPVRVAAMTDFSREAMIRYVELVLSFRSWLSARKTNPRAEMPVVTQLFHDLAAAASSRALRFAGLTPRGRKREAELFHSANVLTLSLLFGGELGLQQPQLVELATAAFFSDVGNLELKDETLERVGPLTDADHQDITTARRWSARFPFVRFGDKPQAVAWASVVLEQETEPGSTGAQGLTASVVALARAYETLTSPTASREAMGRDEAIEVLTQKAAHRFRPELLPLFRSFLQRLSTRQLS
ncbi:MAG: protein kinase [Archangium sp.]|nr:protein kinase [Archangium sp.]